MKYRLSHFTFFVVLLALLVGCTTVREQLPAGPIVLSDELLALLETINAEHRAIVKAEIDEAAIVERWARDPSKYSLDYQIAGSMIDGVLTAQQAKNDVNVLFYSLQTKYGLYEYFGGDEVFNQTREAIFAACDEAGSLTVEELMDMLIANLSFVKDAHFRLDNIPCAKMIYPFHYRAMAFEKTEHGYQAIAEKKQVVSVQGYEDLDALFRRSITDEGAIAYYPVVLVEIAIGDYWAKPNFTPGDLIIEYEDGSTHALSTMPHDHVYDEESANVELYKRQGLPVLFSRKMGFKEIDDVDRQTFLDYAKQLRSEPVALLDLRTNWGGNMALPYEWLRVYTGDYVTGNSYTIEYVTKVRNTSDGYAELVGQRSIGGGLVLSGEQADVFVENDNILVVLMGKDTASAAECMIDLLYNLGNVLFVGDITMGCYVGNGSTLELKLPFSHISVYAGNALRIFPDKDYFQEMRGFLPDLWVPAAQAEELVLKLLLKGD